MISKPDIVKIVKDILHLDFEICLFPLYWYIDSYRPCLLDHSLAACSAVYFDSLAYDPHYRINDNDFGLSLVLHVVLSSNRKIYILCLISWIGIGRFLLKKLFKVIFKLFLACASIHGCYFTHYAHKLTHKLTVNSVSFSKFSRIQNQPHL